MARIKIELPEKAVANIEIPIRITDLNYGNHVGNDAMVGIIHEARVQYLGQLGHSEMNMAGASLIMNELCVTFKNEAFYNDLLEIKIFIGEITRVGFEIFYSISASRGETSNLIAIAKTGLIFFDYATKKILPIPKEIKETLKKSLNI
jgi:acyl-CoA thioester hydrolase